MGWIIFYKITYNKAIAHQSIFIFKLIHDCLKQIKPNCFCMCTCGFTSSDNNPNISV